MKNMAVVSSQGVKGKDKGGGGLWKVSRLPRGYGEGVPGCHSIVPAQPSSLPAPSTLLHITGLGHAVLWPDMLAMSALVHLLLCNRATAPGSSPGLPSCELKLCLHCDHGRPNHRRHKPTFCPAFGPLNPMQQKHSTLYPP